MVCGIMKLIIEGYNKSIHKKDNQIVVKEKDELIYKIPADDIDDITIVGKGYITFDALSLLSRNNVNLITVNYFGQVEYILETPNQKYVQLKKEQYRSSDNEKGLKIAIEIVKTKIKNQKSTIKTLNKNKKIKKVKENENKIKEYLIELEKLEIRDDSSIKNVIMGIEGKISVLYWDSISMLLPESVNFKNRNQKPENDVVNAMLNYGYAILASQITKSILLHGLDAYCGFLHADRYKRTSLTYDLIEEFRQQIVDKTVIKLINYKQIDEDSINHRNNALNLESRKILVAAIMDKLHSEISYGDEKVSYLEIIDNQCSVLVDTLIGDGEYEGFYLQW